MPHTINGVGTHLVPASRKRTVNGLVQFDAVECFVILFLPIVPYKVVHVLAFHETQYQAVQLRFSRRIIAKAFFGSWGMILTLLGGVLTGIVGFISFQEPGGGDDVGTAILASMLGLMVLGAVLWIIRWRMDRADDRLRQLFGSTPVGTSDPADWRPAVATEIGGELLKVSGASRLITAAEFFHRQGDRAKAAICARLAERADDGDAPAARELIELLLRTGTDDHR